MQSSGKQNYKVLVLDLDGTLTNSKKEISQTTLEALKKAQQNGVIVVLASGRPTYGIVPLAEQIDLASFGGFILSFNGGKIINWKTKEVIHERDIDKETIPMLYEMAKEHGVDIISYIDKDIIAENSDNKYILKEASINKMPIRKVSSFVNEIKNPVPKCLIVGDGEVLVPLQEKMNERFGEVMNIFRSEPFFLELMPQNIDKAASLERLLKHLKLTKEQMIACGDGFNDLSMIKYAGLGVAMSNAQDAVKEAADYITLSNDEDGVAHVIEKFIL
ncbi:MAG: Cof-type HAD-IIB family hydrolase [Bacteroidales bacterium]|nr:Cof-type HAD-IIB family hydrolase [Bacteroidales bacterium]